MCFFPWLVQVVVYSHTGKNHCNMFAVRQRRLSEVKWDRLRLIFTAVNHVSFCTCAVVGFEWMHVILSLCLVSCAVAVLWCFVSVAFGLWLRLFPVMCIMWYAVCVCVCVWVGYCCWLPVSVNFINDCFMPQHHNNVICSYVHVE